MKFKQIISKGFQVMLRTRQRTDRRKDGQTDKAPNIIMLPPKFFGEHKNWKLANGKEAGQTAQKCRLAWLYSGGKD
jgi:hypothetical protein